MKVITTVTAVSAYHNYKIGGTLRKEISAGEEGGGFFLRADEAVHPGPFPRISCDLFDGKGRPVASVRRNETVMFGEGCREERGDDALAFFTGEGKMVFSYRVRRYQNVYVTEIEGEFFDEKGRPVTV